MRSRIPGVLNPNSVLDEVFVQGGNGKGSTNANVRRYTSLVRSSGCAITYADSATLGGSFTINTPGVYSVAAMELSNTSDYGLAITRNLTGFQYTNADNMLGISTAANLNCSVSGLYVFSAGDIIRALINHLCGHDATYAGGMSMRIVLVTRTG